MCNSEMDFQLSKKDFKRLYEMNQILKNIYSFYIVNNGIITGKPIKGREDDFEVSHFYSGTINQYLPEYLRNNIVILFSNDIYIYYRDNKTPVAIHCKKNKIYFMNENNDKVLIGKIVEEKEYSMLLNYNRSINIALNTKLDKECIVIPNEIVEKINNYEKVVLEFDEGLKCHASLSLFPTIKKFKNLSAYVFDVDKQPKTFLVLFESVADNGDMFSIVYRFTK